MFVELLKKGDRREKLTTTSPEQDFQDQINEIIIYLKKNPGDGKVLKQLGALYQKAGLFDKAVSAYVSASRKLPKDKEIERAFIELRARGHISGN